MTLRQLRALQEVVKQGLSISAAAAALHTSQPGVSRQILELEQELGVSIFVRKRGRLVSITEAGEALLAVADRMLSDAASLRTIASDYSSKDTGQLSIATTHTHACYTLPRVIQQFSAAFPRVQLSLREGTPSQCCEILAAGGADIAIVTQTSEVFESLATLPAYRLPRCLVVPLGHPLLAERKLTLEKIARFPLITYDSTFSSRRSVDRAFAARGLTPNIVLRAIDADVSKKYVALGLGVAVLPTIAYDATLDPSLRALDVDHLFDQGLVNVCLRKGGYIREFVYAFITMFAPHLTRRLVLRSLSADAAATPPVHDLPAAPHYRGA
ncbi:MAG TPA: LysR substrate-binding domain-containing protein [Burkholderiales bacterium]|nr:LysR substrate-binding domain-containing protein [Burkholderiales bacterium]